MKYASNAFSRKARQRQLARGPRIQQTKTPGWVQNVGKKADALTQKEGICIREEASVSS